MSHQVRLPHQLVGDPEGGVAAAAVRRQRHQLLVPVIHTEAVGESAPSRQPLSPADEHGEEVADGVAAADAGSGGEGRRRTAPDGRVVRRPQPFSGGSERSVAGEAMTHGLHSLPAESIAASDQRQNSQQRQQQQRQPAGADHM